VGDVFRQEFQRYKAAEAGVLGLIDYAHTSATKFFEDGVMGDGATENGMLIRHSPRSLTQHPNVGNATCSYVAQFAFGEMPV
jgi:hypothetical protein